MRSLITTLAIGLAVCSCKRDDASDEGPKPLAFEADPTVITDHMEHRYEIELVEPGAEPREQFRYGAQAPNRTVDFELTMDVGGPRPLAEFGVAWTGIPPDRETRRYLYDVVEVVVMDEHTMDTPEGMIERKIAEALDSIAGQATGSAMGLEGIVQTRGLTAQPSPGYLIQSIALPLPEQAIGVGAVWTRTTRYEQAVGGLRKRPTEPEVDGPKLPRLVPEREYDPVVENHMITETYRYSLIERSEDTLTVAYESSSMPDDPSRVTSSKSSGRFVVSLSDPLPRSGTLDTTTHVVFPGLEIPADERDDLRSSLVVTTRE